MILKKEFAALLVTPYNFVCGVCGIKFNKIPKVCPCGNDVEFERLK